MRLRNWYFVRVGNRIIIANGKSPLRYFDLRTLRLHTYEKVGPYKVTYTVKEDK